MRHNELKTRVYDAVLRLETFTVSELCDLARLSHKQVYGELLSLQDDGYLQTEPLATPPGVTRGRHRPPKLYRLVPETDKRSSLALEIRRFRPSHSSKYTDEELLSTTNLSLNKIELQLEQAQRQLAERAIDSAKLLEIASTALERLTEVKDQLERASYRSSAPHDESADNPLALEANRWRLYRSAAESLRQQAEARKRVESAQADYAKVLASLVNVHDLSPECVAKEFDREADASSVELRRIFSSVLAEVTCRVHARPDADSINAVLAESAIRYGSDPKVILQWTRRVSGAEITGEYNRLNVVLLIGENQNTFDAWQEWATSRLSGQEFKVQGFRYNTYPWVETYCIQHEVLRGWRIEDIEREFAEVNFSIVSAHPLPGYGSPGYLLVPTLFDPLGRSQSIELPEVFRTKQPDWFVYGALENRVQLPGIPKVRLATGLVALGLDKHDAWTAASELNTDTALLVLYSDRIPHTEPASVNRLAERGSAWRPRARRAFKPPHT